MTEEEWDELCRALEPQPGNDAYDTDPEFSPCPVALAGQGQIIVCNAVEYFAEVIRETALTNPNSDEFYLLMAAHYVLKNDPLAASQYMQQRKLAQVSDKFA